MDAMKADVLTEYKQDVERWKERGVTHLRDIQKPTVNDALYLKAVIHPTNKADSKKLTEELVKFICDQEIVTAQDIYTALGLSDKPVLKRLKILREQGYVRRMSKKYYIPTPRLHELRKRYLNQVCI